MSSYQILDSSPIRIPSLRDTDDHPRPLKRSASVASLPTPPRTYHKRSRSKGRSTTSRNASEDSGSASELDEDLGGGYAASISKATSKSEDENRGDKGNYAHAGRKKRRTTEVLFAQDEEEDYENAFWTGRSGDKASTAKKSPALEVTDEDKSPSPALLKYRVRVPVSPPPSRRAPQVQPRASSVQRSHSRSPPPTLLLPELPVTPPPKLFLRAPPLPSKSKAKKIWPTRDSPDNPFLAGEEAGTSKASGWESSDDELPVGEARERESTPTPVSVFEEKPTITYVLYVSSALFAMISLLTQVLAAAKKRLSTTRYTIFLPQLLKRLNCLSIIQTLKWLRHVRPVGSLPTSSSASFAITAKIVLRIAHLTPSV